MQTKSVDINFENVLSADLPTINKDRVEIENDEFKKDLEEDQEEDLGPLSRKTRDEILLCYINAINATNPQNVDFILNHIKKMEYLSEKEGRILLEALHANNVHAVSSEAVTILIKILSKQFINPVRPDIRKEVVKDKFIRMSISGWISRIFCWIGDMAGVILFVLYSLESYSNINPFREDGSETTEFSDRPSSALSNDVLSEIPKRQDNIIN